MPIPTDPNSISTTTITTQLEEFKRRTGYSSKEKLIKSYADTSPYYRGLTDSTLFITRQKGSNVVLLNTSPENESSRGSTGTSATSSSIPTVLFQIKELGYSSKEKLIKSYADTSPYYRGLTDSTLFITRQKGSDVVVLNTSPGNEISRGSTGTSSTSSSIPTVLFQIKEMGCSCFKTNNGDSRSKENSTAAASSSSSSSSNTVKSKDVKKSEIGLSRKTEETEKTESSNTSTSAVMNKEENPLMSKEKPMNERVTASAASSSGDGGAPSAEVVLSVVRVRENKIMKKNKEKVILKESRKYVWADQYRPKALKDFICNKDKAGYLHNLVKERRQCSHYIFEGRAGVGKTTMILAFLREAFELEHFVTREERRTFELKGETVPSIEVNVKVSSHHVELNLSELCGYEKHVIVALIKETKTMIKCQAKCYAIIIHEADKLSEDAQLYIRWLMERNKTSNKIFFCCSEISKLQHIRSICTVIELLPPSNEEIVEVLEFIAKREGIQLPHQLAERIAENSKHNLRQAVRSLEASWMLNHKFNEDQVILTGWEEDVANIAENIIEEQGSKQLYVIRGKLQKLIDHNVSPDFIFSSLVEELKNLLSNEFHPKIDAFYLEYKMNSRGNFEGEKSLVLLHSRYKESRGKGNNDLRKDVEHFMLIEEFTAKFMTFYKAYMKKKKNIERENGGSERS